MMCLTLIWTMYLLCNFIGINIINQYVSMRHHLIVDLNYVSVRNSLLDASFCIRIINHYVSIRIHSLVDVTIGIKIIYHYVSKRHHSLLDVLILINIKIMVYQRPRQHITPCGCPLVVSILTFGYLHLHEHKNHDILKIKIRLLCECPYLHQT